MGTLEQQVAIVTGGGTGIGEAVALALAKEGANVVICGRRIEPLQRVLSKLSGRGLAVHADVSREDDVERLVNNAGISGGSAIHEHEVAAWDQIMAVNLRGPFLLARAVLPTMREKRHGHIINISSESGLEYYPGDGAYGVSKHALNALSEYIQRENQELDIRVNTVCPGMVVTEMTEGSAGLNQDKCLYPDEIADLVMWLVTRRANIKIGRPILIQTMENPWT
ncbi:MAG: SDR family oxidoreductase [Anaerolineae bacterium]|nr:SDR family oxidoreductase [Anaerolineae bacterium]